jgi:hypothetical protein
MGHRRGRASRTLERTAPTESMSNNASTDHREIRKLLEQVEELENIVITDVDTEREATDLAKVRLRCKVRNVSE